MRFVLAGPLHAEFVFVAGALLGSTPYTFFCAIYLLGLAHVRSGVFPDFTKDEAVPVFNRGLFFLFGFASLWFEPFAFLVLGMLGLLRLLWRGSLPLRG
jgi:hypothetical protein